MLNPLGEPRENLHQVTRPGCNFFNYLYDFETLTLPLCIKHGGGGGAVRINTGGHLMPPLRCSAVLCAVLKRAADVPNLHMIVSLGSEVVPPVTRIVDKADLITN
jgi:hypothetical protein